VTSDDLIERLVADLTPVRRGAVTQRIAAGIGAGVAASGVLMWLWLGLRPDLGAAVATPAYWMKFAYTLAPVTSAPRGWPRDRRRRPAWSRWSGSPEIRR
jgi:hypothetical protein